MKPFCGTTVIPMFWTSGDVSSGFQSQSGQPYSCLAEVYVSLRFTSGATAAVPFVANTVGEPSSTYLRGIGGTRKYGRHILDISIYSTLFFCRPLGRFPLNVENQ